jgi:HEPN domain-containing protein
LDIACFHCQQAVEKYLKAFLVFKNEAFPQTHNLDLLLQLCRKHDNSFDDIDLKNLEDFAVRGRYPHDFISPEPEESESFYQDTVIVKTMVSKKIQEKYPAVHD